MSIITGRGERFFAPTVESPEPCFFRFRVSCLRILSVGGPARGVVEDVLPYTVQGFFVADNVLVVAALPDRVVTRGVAKPFCYADFESANNGRESRARGLASQQKHTNRHAGNVLE